MRGCVYDGVNLQRWRRDVGIGGSGVGCGIDAFTGGNDIALRPDSCDEMCVVRDGIGREQCRRRE